ncbi:MAG: hypothetical protein IH905_17775, partial [Proteobacteria bacterium]|nr:hypothetical protein [Pseudomonadota bacterium]
EGEPLAAVVAESPEHAEAALAVIEFEIEEQEPVATPEQALRRAPGPCTRIGPHPDRAALPRQILVAALGGESPHTRTCGRKS